MSGTTTSGNSGLTTSTGKTGLTTSVGNSGLAIADTTPAVVAAFTPLDLAGLAQWYRGSSLVVDGVLDGQQISTWRDESGNARNIAQATASLRPILVASALNGHPVVRCDGVDDVLFCVGLPGYAVPTDIFVVAKKRVVPGVFGRMLAFAVDPSFFALAGPAQFGAYKGLNVSLWATDASFHAFTFHIDGASSLFRKDGGNELTGNPGPGNFQPTFELGAGSSTGLEAGDFDFAELAVCSPALSVADRTRMEEYLLDKYAL